jgi:hypothetical protein
MQGLLLVGILSGAQPSDTFNAQATSRTKVYLIFILSFTTITNAIVSSKSQSCREILTNASALYWLNTISHYKAHYGINVY